MTGLVGVALFFATAFTPLAHALNLLMAVEPQLVPSDAIVVLGAAVSPSGILSAESTRRTDHAIELYQKGLAPRPLFERAGFEVRVAPSDTSIEPTAPEARVMLMRGPDHGRFSCAHAYPAMR